MHKALPLYVLAGIGGLVSVSSHAQQEGPAVSSSAQRPARVLTEDQINTYWLYAQERLSKNDLRTAMATLYFLVNSQGLSEEMRETADNALLQTLERQESNKRGKPVNGSPPASVAIAKPVAPAPTVVLEEVSTTTVVTVAETDKNQSDSVTDQSIESVTQPNIENENVTESADVTFLSLIHI